MLPLTDDRTRNFSKENDLDIYSLLFVVTGVDLRVNDTSSFTQELCQLND